MNTFCTHCGNKMNENQKFCTKCGSSANTTVLKEPVVIKCGNCDYSGPGEKARSLWATVLAWLCVFFAPIITIIYFVVTHKYRCPKCRSTFLGIRDKEGKFVGQKWDAKSPVLILVWIIVGVAIIGILSSIVLASLNTAREKALSGQNTNFGTQKHDNTELTLEVMREIARDHSKELPMMLDEDTRLDSIEGIKGGLIYKYTLVNYSLEDFKEISLNELLRQDIVDGICSNLEMEVYVRNDAILKYTYYDMYGRLIETISVNTGVEC